MKLLIWIILELLAISSCGQNKNKILDDSIKRYLELKRLFNPRFVDHFPNQIDTSYLDLSGGHRTDGGLPMSLVLTCKLDNSKLIQEAKEKSIQIYNASDTCLLIVNRFANYDKFYNIKKGDIDKTKIDRECYSTLLPIPNFWNSSFNIRETECQLPKEFKIFVFEANSGEFEDHSLLADTWFMPEKWKHGFSKGVAISEKRNVIVYWVNIW